MEQHTIVISGTASYCGLTDIQHSSTDTSNNYKISEILGDYDELHSHLLPDKQYRVVAGHLYAVRAGSPPNSP